ncbi:MAG TPA: hypothetical protein VF820_07100 [Patescibacteria group bacterium]
MEFILGFLLFSLAAYFSFYLPGTLVLSWIFPTLKQNYISLISWSSGILLFLFTSYLGGYIHFAYLSLVIVIGVFLFALFYDKSLFKLKIERKDLWSWVIIILGSLTFLSLTAFSYIQTHAGIQFFGTINVIDGLLHIGYTKNLLTTFPPNHAGLSNITLRGYHYFYDLLISRLVLFYHFSSEDLYYRYLPLFISLIYGVGFWEVSKNITSNKFSQRMVLFFAYFAQSFAFVLSFFIHSIPITAELGSIYPLELILNPAIILSIGIMLSSVSILFESKQKPLQMIFVGFLFGMIFELKVYTGIIGMSVFTLILLLKVIKVPQNSFSYCLSFLTAVIVIAITYIPNNFGAGSLWFSPFFAYSVYMQEPPFLGWQWELKRIVFRDHHNIPHLIFLYAEAIGLFWLLSLGSRIVLLLGLPTIFKSSFWKDEKNIAIGGMIGVPILVGSLFVQSVSIFDTKQFLWIAGALIALPAGMATGAFLTGKKTVIKVSVLGILVFLSLGGVLGQLNNFLFFTKASVISQKDVVLLQKVRSIVPPNGFILYINEDNPQVSLSQNPFQKAPVIAALTGRSTYYESESAQFALAEIYRDRQKNLLVLDTYLHKTCNNTDIKGIIKKIGTPYIVITSSNPCLDQLATSTLESSTGLTFYQVKL